MNEADRPARSAITRPDRPLVIAVSLKMYLDPADTVQWSSAVAAWAGSHPALREGRVRLIVLPSLPSLQKVVKIFAGTAVEVGAQDLFWEDRGPYTGAVSGADLRQIGCRYVEVGHVERQRIFGEDDTIASRKLAAALRNGLTPIVCVGEDHKVPPETAAIQCIERLEGMLRDVSIGHPAPRIIFAYEPAWAIGMPEPASIDHIVAVVAALRAWIGAQTHLGDAALIYGGSAGVGLLPALTDAADGLFLGRFAHDPSALRAILDETLQLG
jgi:triosephosphate isomerase